MTYILVLRMVRQQKNNRVSLVSAQRAHPPTWKMHSVPDGQSVPDYISLNVSINVLVHPSGFEIDRAYTVHTFFLIASGFAILEANMSVLICELVAQDVR